MELKKKKAQQNTRSKAYLTDGFLRHLSNISTQQASYTMGRTQATSYNEKLFRKAQQCI